MNKVYVLCLLFFSLTFGTSAQLVTPPCGLSPANDAPLMERLRHNKATLEDNPQLAQSFVASHIPMVFHLVRKEEFVGGANPIEVLEQICSINNFFATQGSNLQFYLQDINVINDSEAYLLHFEPDGKQVLEVNRVEKVINVFMVGDASSNDQTGGGVTLAYYSSANDWIIIRKDEINGTSETLAHEIGHFFSLPHPFRGWDFEPYNPVMHGEQVGDFSPSVNFSSSIANEKQDGSNCESAGDEICDTPPDYNHSGVDWGCNYQGGAKDPSGTLIEPDEKNIMAYFISCPNKGFSNNQKDLMGTDLFNRILDETIVKGSASEGGVLGGQPTLQKPGSNANRENFTTIDFEWDEVENAQGYILEVDDSPSFAFGIAIRLTVENSYSLGEEFFETNKEYYWRVKAYNASSTCVDWSTTFSFNTNVLTNTNSPTNNWSVSLSPNPVLSSTPIQLGLELAESDFISWKIIDLNGKIIHSEARQNYPPGSHLVAMDWKALYVGVYVVVVNSGDSIWREKFIVF